MFKKILFPLDQSREAKDAAALVSDLVKLHHSELILLSVVEKVPVAVNAHPGMDSPETVAQLLQAAQSGFRQQGINAQVIEREGIPPFVICDVADEVSADLIVMGCRGLGLTQEGAAESVTSRVTNLSPCPVLVVP